MTNRRITSSSVTSGDIAQRAALALQTRSSVFPVIELAGKTQTLGAGTLTQIQWGEIIRQTDQPITEYRTTGNYLWPRFVSPSASPPSNSHQIVINASGYYSFTLMTYIATASTSSIRFQILDSSGTIVIASRNFAFASGNEQNVTFTIFISARQIVQFFITSTVANTFAVSTVPVSASPSPRLIIAQIAQFEDSLIGKTTRLSSTSTASIASNTFTAVTYTTLPSGAVSNDADLYSFNAGGSNQLDGWDSSVPSRIYIKESGMYLITAQVLQVAGTNTGTRTIAIVIDATQVVASHSVAASATASRLTQTSTTAYIATGSYVNVYTFQDSGVAQTLSVATDLHRFSVTYLGD